MKNRALFGRLICCFTFCSPLIIPVWSQEAPGPVVYEQKGQFTISLPTGWTVYDQGSLLPGLGQTGYFGMVIFSAAEFEAATMGKIDIGEIPSFWVNRQEADKGMSCAGLPEKSHRGIVKMVERRGGKPVGKFQVEPKQVGGCAGIQIRGSRVNDSIELQVEVRAVSDGKTLYLFALDQRKEFFEKNRHFYEQSMGSLRMAAATPRAE